jgi:hypothetical protein
MPCRRVWFRAQAGQPAVFALRVLDDLVVVHRGALGERGAVTQKTNADSARFWTLRATSTASIAGDRAAG